MSQALYRKWRPRLWEQVVGQEHIVQTLRNAIRSGRVAHAYLFAGPRGTGKTTTARLLAKAVNCLSPNNEDHPCDACDHCLAVNQGRFLDLIEIDAASNTGVEDIRDLREKINFSPTQGKFKVYIIDEVHMLSTAAFNALLKTLEEPPAHAIFILATTEVHKIPATVLSRCQWYEFRRIPVPEIVRHLSQLAEQEKIIIEDAALMLIARQSTGSLRDAISLLDQLASVGDLITLDYAQNILGTATPQIVVELIECIQQEQLTQGLNCLHQALDSGTDPRQLARQIVDTLRGLLMVSCGAGEQGESTPEQAVWMAAQAGNFPQEKLLRLIKGFNDAAGGMRNSWHPGLPLEIALINSMMPDNLSILQEVADSRTIPSAIVPPPVKAKTLAHPVAPSPEQESAVEQPAHQPSQPQQQPSGSATGTTNSAQETPAMPPLKANEGGIQRILRNWQSIKSLLKKTNSKSEALLNSCKPMELKDNTLTLGFASDVVKKTMESGDHCKLISQAILQCVGIEVAIQCVVIDPQSMSQKKNLEIDQDGIVNAAIGLGGKVIEQSDHIP